MRLPQLNVTTDEGQTVPLASLGKGGPFALVFLRHLGCIFCREHVRDFRSHPEIPVWFVARASVAETKAFREGEKSPHGFIADHEGELAKALAIASGGYGQILNAHTFGRAFKATLRGIPLGKPQSDPMVLGASFVIDGESEIVWEHRAKDAADNATVTGISERIKEAKSPIPSGK